MDMAMCYDNIGMALCDLGNIESGLEYYEQALVIKKWEVLESLDVANTHNIIGTDLKNLAKWDKSMQHFKIGA
jgi:tetratricopeptide (TPR) repeat protein